MVKMLLPRRVTYATVSSPSVVTTLLCCYYCSMLSGIFLEIPFDSHKYITYFVGCVVFTSFHGVPICSYFVEAEDKVTALQSGYGVCVVKLWRDFASSLVSTKRRQLKNRVTRSCHSVFFADFEQVSYHYNSYFCLLSLSIDLLRSSNL